MGRGNFLGEKGHPIVKYRDILRSSVQKRLNRSICHFGCGFGWAQGIINKMNVQIPLWEGAILVDAPL